MAAHSQRLPHGVTATGYDPGTAPWELQPEEYSEVPGMGMQRIEHPNWLSRNMWWLAPAGLAAGAGAGALLSGSGAAAGAAATTAVPSMPWTIPAGFEASMAGGATAASVTGATAAALKKAGVSDAVIHQLTNLAKDPTTYAGLAALLPSLMGGGGNSPFGGDTSGLMHEATQALALQRKRVEQAQPVYDTLVNMAYGMSPTHYRGSAPAGYTPNAAPEGAYEMRGPQFGRNG